MGNLIQGLAGIFGGDQQISGSERQNVYGQLPFQLAGGLGGMDERLLRYLGFGPQAGTRAAGRQERRLAGATGPLAAAIRGIRGFAGDVIPQAEQVGREVSAAGSEAFTTLQQQVQQLLGAVPEALGGAEQYFREAFGPTAMDPFFERATERAVQPHRSEFAARGLGDTGVEAGAEARLRSNLSEQFAQGQLGMQAGAPGLLTSTAGAGIPGIAELLAALPTFQTSQLAPTALPLGQAGSLLNLLTAGQSPALSLLGLTGPQFTPFSRPTGLGQFK